jgi:hypothetical protein
MLADDDNYRERRYFTGWSKMKKIEEFILPDFIQEITKQVIKKLAPFIEKIIKKKLFNRKSYHLATP